jgi:hypothetical protein
MRGRSAIEAMQIPMPIWGSPKSFVGLGIALILDPRHLRLHADL